MTFALNTGHALYGNLKMFIGVNESNALTDLVNTGRTFTPNASAVFGSGTLGRHFGVRRSGYTVYGASMSTVALPSNTGTLVIVTNAVRYGDVSNLSSFIGTNSSTPVNNWQPQLIIKGSKTAAMCYDSGGGGVTAVSESGSTSYSSSPHMLTLTRNGETAYYVYADGSSTPIISGTKLGTNVSSQSYSFLGGVDGNSPTDFDLVYAVWFDKVLSTTEISDLYTSLGASNAFALLDAGGGGDTTIPTLTGSITIGTVTTTSIQASWPAGADDTAVTSYETKLDSGSWVDRGNVLTYTHAGLIASTGYTIQVRAKDAVGNVSTPALSVTQSTSAGGGSGYPPKINQPMQRMGVNFYGNTR